MDFITAQIAVGSRACAADERSLAERGIDALLSLAPVARPAGVGRQFSIDVTDGAPLGGETINDAVGFLKEQAGRGRRVLIHCEMGISRSPALAACYLHEVLGMALAAALEHVRRCRPQARPHPELIASLRAHYRGADATVDLSGNENPLGPSPLAMQAIRAAIPDLHRYPERDGSALRELLARRLAIPVEEIVLGNGSCELIELVARACLDAGSDMLLPEPAFPAYRSAAERCAARVVPVPMPGGRYAVEEIIGRLTPATRLVVIASPHNPTGSLLPRADLARLLAALPPAAWLLLDEAYRDYAPPAELPELPCGPGRNARLIVLRSLSKVHGLAGLRIGYGIAPRPMAERLQGMTQQYNTSSLAQIAAAAALDDEAHRASSVAGNALGLAVLERGIAELGIDYLPSTANFVLLRAGEQAVRRFAEHGVRVKDMARYGLPEHIRVSVGRPADNARFLAVLAELCRAGALTEQPIHA